VIAMVASSSPRERIQFIAQWRTCEYYPHATLSNPSLATSVHLLPAKSIHS